MSRDWRFLTASAVFVFWSQHACADSIGIGLGINAQGNFIFEIGRGPTEEIALELARQLCFSDKLAQCQPIAQFSRGCLAHVVGKMSNGTANVYRGKTIQEAMKSCSVGGADCNPPLSVSVECAGKD